MASLKASVHLPGHVALQTPNHPSLRQPLLGPALHLAVQDTAGLVRDSGCTIYTVEGHINFLREVHAGANLTYTTQILGCDAKRIHVFHSMIDEGTGDLVATNELMFLHVNQATMKVEPMPGDLLERLQEIYRAHGTLAHRPTLGEVSAADLDPLRRVAGPVGRQGVRRLPVVVGRVALDAV